MKKLLTLIFTFMIITYLSACGDEDNVVPQVPPQTGEQSGENNEDDSKESEESMKLQIIVGSTEFTATLENNPTANAFKQLLPMTINMSELNNNEKYYRLSLELPTNTSNPGTIQSGDLMLYGSTTLVLFYKTFSSSYSYTRIGRIDNPSGLEAALGSGNVSVVFEMQ